MPELRTAPRQQRSRRSIDAILDAAERLIHEQGQVSFTANELATSAGMSIGRVYYWFPDIPSVVNALAERATARLLELFARLLDGQQHATTPLLIERAVTGLCEHLDANPATVALCLTGGDNSFGTDIQEGMTELARRVVRARVSVVPDAEVEVVARTVVGITLGMLRGYTRAGDLRSILRQELVYVLSAWLYCRYPNHDDPIWDAPVRSIMPSRRPVVGVFREDTPVYPALSPLEP
jgi:AcrR family transcriptional regulator